MFTALSFLPKGSDQGTTKNFQKAEICSFMNIFNVGAKLICVNLYSHGEDPLWAK